MLRRFPGVTRLYPRLALGITHAEVRRTIKPLRTGTMHSADPRIPSHALADLLEGSIAQDMPIYGG